MKNYRCEEWLDLQLSLLVVGLSYNMLFGIVFSLNDYHSFVRDKKSMTITAQSSTHISQFERILGAKNVITDKESKDRYCWDWSRDLKGSTLAVLRPASTDEVCKIVRYCNEKLLNLIPQGGHSGLVYGALPQDEENHVVISMERINKIRKINALDFSMEVEAGCILENVKDFATTHGCTFPLSLGAQGSCQIGGNVATNAGGFNVLRYGMMRELVLGLEVVLPNGEVFNCMSSLRKDNRGIDLKHLFIGSEGSMGIITAVSLKLFPKPEQVVTAFLGLDSVQDAIELFASARRDCCDLLSAFEFMDDECIDLAFKTIPDLIPPLESRYAVNILLEVTASGLIDLQSMVEKFLMSSMENELVKDGTIATSQTQADNLWLIREALTEGQARHGQHLRTDVSVSIADLPEFLDKAYSSVQAACPGSRQIPFGHIGDGNIHYNLLPPEHLSEERKSEVIKIAEKCVFETVDAFNGSISAEHGIGRLKQNDFLRRLPVEQRRILEGIKSTIDPKQILNSGCILPANTISQV